MLRFWTFALALAFALPATAQEAPEISLTRPDCGRASEPWPLASFDVGELRKRGSPDIQR
ncbi:MAG: hypothetical protein WBA68_05175 [Alteraurantiacibacter sp.]